MKILFTKENFQMSTEQQSDDHLFLSITLNSQKKRRGGPRVFSRIVLELSSRKLYIHFKVNLKVHKEKKKKAIYD